MNSFNDTGMNTAEEILKAMVSVRCGPTIPHIIRDDTLQGFKDTTRVTKHHSTQTLSSSTLIKYFCEPVKTYKPCLLSVYSLRLILFTNMNILYILLCTRACRAGDQTHLLQWGIREPVTSGCR